MLTATDFTFENHGTIVVIRPRTRGAHRLLRDSFQTEPWQWLGECLCVDWRFAQLVADVLRGELS